MSEETILATRPTAAMTVNSRGVKVESFGDLWKLANCVVVGGMAPRGMETTEKVVAAMSMGMELGIPPMAALRGIAVINGRPSVYGDLAISLVHASGALEYIVETIEGTGDDQTATCKVKRANRPNEVVRTFSTADARRAALWGKAGPWTQFPKRMLQMRARAFALRDEFADVLQGMHLAEEAQDIEPPPEDARPINVRVIDKVNAALPAPSEPQPPVVKESLTTETPPDEGTVDEPDEDDAIPEPWETLDSLKASIDEIAKSRGHGPEVVDGAWRLQGLKVKGAKWTVAERKSIYETALAARGNFAGLTIREPAPT